MFLLGGVTFTTVLFFYEIQTYDKLSFLSHSTKSSLCINCKTGTQRFVKLLCFNFLLGWWLMSIRHGTFCGVTKTTFASMDKLTLTTIKFGQRKTLMLFINMHLKKVTVWCGFRATFITWSYLFEEIIANGIQICFITE